MIIIRFNKNFNHLSIKFPGFLLLFVISFCHFVLGENGGKGGGPVCIIGGGISGLSVSKLLQDKGYDVKLFERDGFWGGKVATFRTPGNNLIMERGAVVFGPFQHYINRYMKHYNCSKVPYDLYDFALIDPKSGGQYRYVMNRKQWRQTQRGFEKVAHHIIDKNPPSYLEFGFADLPPTSELALPYGKFLANHGLRDIHVAASIVGTTTGYGDMDVLPTIYAYRLMRPNDTVATFKHDLTWFMAAEGYDLLMNRMADDVHKRFLHHEAIKVNRGKDGQRITFVVEKKRKIVEKCWKTILAFPPLMKNVRIIEDMEPSEEALFAQIKVHKYLSSGHVIPSFKYNNYFGFTPKAAIPEGREIFPKLNYPSGNGDLVMFSKSLGSKNPHAYTGYWWISGDFDDWATAADLKNVKNRLTNLIKKTHPFSLTFFLDNWEYFPHVDTASIQNGFFQKFDKIQGKGGLYYATTMLTFEMMDYALEMADKFTEKYF